MFLPLKERSIKNLVLVLLQIKMNISRLKTDYRKLDTKILKRWSKIPTCIVGDCMNRQNIMSSRIESIENGMSLCGQARTVSVTHGDNSAIHAALTLINKGEVLVVDGGGFLDRAVWGELMNRSSIKIGLEGVVIDGSVRDVAELRKLSLPVFSAGINATGPTKGGGGKIDVLISCGNVAIKPGDIIIGDDDGVAVIPLEHNEKHYEESIEKIKMEEETIKEINSGKNHKDIFGIREIPYIIKKV